MNPMELYHNQVTRTQGAFSLRMFHRSWGIMLIQANIQAPCTVLDFPDARPLRRRASHEPVRRRRHHRHHSQRVQGREDVRVGPRSISPVRRSSSAATSPTFPACASRVDADHVVKGEGVAWFRRFLGEDAARPIRHPAIVSGIGTRNMGVDRAATAPATWPPRSSRRSAARWAATSAPPRPCSAARASRSTSTRPATSCSTSCASSNAT